MTIVLPYILGFWLYVYAALRILTGSAVPGTPDGWSMAVLWGFALAAIVLGTSLARAAGLGFRDLGMTSRPARSSLHPAAIACLAYLFMWISFRTGQLWPPASSEQVGRIPDAPTALLYSLHAGFTEEILILGIPVAVMTKMRLPAPAQIAVLTAARLLIHLYYGFPMALTLTIVWTSLWWLLYTKTGSLLPFIAAHILYDLVASNASFGPPGKALVVFALAAQLIAVVLLIRTANTKWRNRRSRQQCGQNEPPR